MGSSMKHTPGPWVVCVDSMDNYLTVEQDRQALPDGEEPAVVAQIEDMGEGIDRPVGEANAALIAAAPDLLAALRDVLPFVCAGAADVEVARARAAIAKAEGGAGDPDDDK